VGRVDETDTTKVACVSAKGRAIIRTGIEKEKSNHPNATIKMNVHEEHTILD